MSEPFSFRRAIHFDEIDAAGFVYFPRLAAMAHEGMEAMIAAALPAGGYAQYVVGKRQGLPCVKLVCEFTAPLRFGDEVEVRMLVGHLGRSSVRFDVTLVRGDGVAAATIGYTCAFTDLSVAKSLEIPPELRLVFERAKA